MQFQPGDKIRIKTIKEMAKDGRKPAPNSLAHKFHNEYSNMIFEIINVYKNHIGIETIEFYPVVYLPDAMAIRKTAIYRFIKVNDKITLNQNLFIL